MATASNCISLAVLPTTTPKTSAFPLICAPSFYHRSFASRFIPDVSLSSNSSPKTLHATSINVRAKPVLCSTYHSAKESLYGPCFWVGDNTGTYEITPPEHQTLDPSNREDYEKLGSQALSGLPASSYPIPFVKPGKTKTEYVIIIAGGHFGFGSLTEHGAAALEASGAKAVVADSYSEMFFRNSVSAGEVYLFKSEGKICYEFSTGNSVTIEMGVEKNKLINHTTGKEYVLKLIRGGAGGIILDDPEKRMLAVADTVKGGHQQQINLNFWSKLFYFMKRAFP